MLRRGKKGACVLGNAEKWKGEREGFEISGKEYPCFVCRYLNVLDFFSGTTDSEEIKISVQLN